MKSGQRTIRLLTTHIVQVELIWVGFLEVLFVIKGGGGKVTPFSYMKLVRTMLET